MKKVTSILLLISLLMVGVSFAPITSAEEEYTYNVVKSDHKVRNKWDLSGIFIAHPGYNWGGLKEGATWEYSIHIKEAMNGDYSVGSIRFTSGDVEVVGHVKQTQADYNYWGAPNLAAAGTTVYNDVKYNFLFLYSNRAIWFAISTAELEPYWSNETVWGHSLRDYQLHSKVPDEIFIMDPKDIH